MKVTMLRPMINKEKAHCIYVTSPLMALEGCRVRQKMYLRIQSITHENIVAYVKPIPSAQTVVIEVMTVPYAFRISYRESKSLVFRKSEAVHLTPVPNACNVDPEQQL